MYELHWLPIHARIVFKLLLLTYKALNGQAPAYISELISDYQPNRTLRSSSLHLLKETPGRTVTYGRGFSSAAPKLWNSLPLLLRTPQSATQFKSRLKTHIFKTVYTLFKFLHCFTCNRLSSPPCIILLAVFKYFACASVVDNVSLVLFSFYLCNHGNHVFLSHACF